MKANWIFIACLLAHASGAQAVTYSIDRTIGAGTVVGFVETDGTIGALTDGNIVDWAFTLTSPSLDGGSPDAISLAGGAFQISAGLSASATELLFDFSVAGFTYFQESSGLTFNGWCLAGPGGCGSVGGTNAESIFYAPGLFGAAESVAQTGVVSVGSVTSVVPLPASLTFLLAGIGGMALLRRNQRQREGRP